MPGGGDIRGVRTESERDVDLERRSLDAESRSRANVLCASLMNTPFNCSEQGFFK